jgi:hypothetical protein
MLLQIKEALSPVVFNCRGNSPSRSSPPIIPVKCIYDLDSLLRPLAAFSVRFESKQVGDRIIRNLISSILDCNAITTRDILSGAPLRRGAKDWGYCVFLIALRNSTCDTRRQVAVVCRCSLNYAVVGRRSSCALLSLSLEQQLEVSFVREYPHCMN